VIMGATVFYSAILIFLLFVIDLVYTWIDPRIKLAGRDS
jgi:ABC-type dipeptide/oligopeptide/nickel transport system permease component